MGDMSPNYSGFGCLIVNAGEYRIQSKFSKGLGYLLQQYSTNKQLCTLLQDPPLVYLLSMTENFS